jgi:hypothetical protein
MVRGSAGLAASTVARKALAAGLCTALLAFGGLGFRAATAAVDPSERGVVYAPAFRGETRGPGMMMNAHDGQAFGSLALDPLLAHPGDWSGGKSQMAYRAARPLLGWLVMLTSFGSARIAGWSLLVWTAIGLGVMAAGAFVLATAWGRRGDWVPLLLLLPAVVGQLRFGGMSDGLATGLALIGLAFWLERRDRLALVAFCLAALSRESTLLVPLALLLATPSRRMRPLVLPFAVYAGWVGVVWFRLQALPTDASQSHIGAPLVGLIRALPTWNWVEVVSAISVAALAGVALWRAPVREVRALVALSALLAMTMQYEVWRSWDFTRPLLPVTVIGACLLARPFAPPSVERKDEVPESAAQGAAYR